MNERIAGKPNLVSDSNGNLYFPDTNHSKIWQLTANGELRVYAGSTPGSAPPYADGLRLNAIFSRPYLLAIDRSDNLFVFDYGNSPIRRISSDGVVTTTGYRMNGFLCLDVALAHDETIYCTITQPGTWNSGHKIVKLLSNGTATDFVGSGAAGFEEGVGTAARFNAPNFLVTDSSGTLFVSDLLNYRVRKVTKNGTVTTLAGDGIQGDIDGVGTQARFHFDTQAYGGLSGLGYLAIDPADNLIVGDMRFSYGTLRKISPTGEVKTFCGARSDSFVGACTESNVWANAGLAVAPNGTIFMMAGDGMYKVSR